MADFADYVQGDIIGVTNIEADCTTWETVIESDISNTERAFLLSLRNLLQSSFIRNSGSGCLTPNEEGHLRGIEVIEENLYKTAYIQYLKDRFILYNTLICTPLTGVVNQSLNAINPDYNTLVWQEDTNINSIPFVSLVIDPSVTIDIDYGSGTFSEQLFTNYEESTKEFMCRAKAAITFATGIDFEQSEIPLESFINTDP